MVNEVIALVQCELFNHRVSPWMELAPALPVAVGDRVQLQQVIINLAINGIESMQAVTELWAEPNLPQGAIFHFTLPLHREDAS
jgi:signal transduction histidine kinase